VIRLPKAGPSAAAIVTVIALTVTGCASHGSGSSKTSSSSTAGGLAAPTTPATTSAAPTTPTTVKRTTTAPTKSTTVPTKSTTVPTKTSAPTTTASTTPSVASTSASASATPSGNGPTDAQEDRTETSIKSLTSYLGSGGVSIKAVDLHDGVTWAYGASGGMRTGSIVKLIILETLLLQHQKAHTTLSSAQRALATRMIENSDNSAASALWNTIGATSGATRTLGTLGVHDTVLGTDGYWGLTQTCATDYIALLHNLIGSSALTPASRSYTLNLMSHIEADQDWGVSAAADPGTTVRLKNGWLGTQTDHGRWLVNSVGIVTVHGQRVLIAVLTQHGHSFQQGIDLVEKLAKLTANLVTTNP
jgi:hypothetical protein